MPLDTIELDAALFQHWEDQTVLSLGVSFMATPRLTLRAGANRADNPVPDRYLKALFPAITEDHISAGLSYDFNDARALHFAVSRAMPISATNPGDPDAGIPPVTSSHSQLNWQLIYTMEF